MTLLPRRVARVESALGRGFPGEEMAAWSLDDAPTRWAAMRHHGLIPWKYPARKGSAPALAPQPYF